MNDIFYKTVCVDSHYTAKIRSCFNLGVVVSVEITVIVVVCRE